MKAVKKMAGSNKGLVSFLLIFIFLNAGVTRNFIFSMPAQGQPEARGHHSASKHTISPFSEDNSSVSYLDQSKKDNDADDVEIAFFGDITFKTLTPYFTRHNFAGFIPYRAGYRVPLYDLFCNWKFHLA